MAARETTLALRALGRPDRRVGEDASLDHARLRAERDRARRRLRRGRALRRCGRRARRARWRAATRRAPVRCFTTSGARSARRTGDDAAAASHFRDGARRARRRCESPPPGREAGPRGSDRGRSGRRGAHHLLGNLLYGLGQKQEGLRQWQEAVRLNEGLALAWRNVGYAESQQRDDRSALVAYDRPSPSTRRTPASCSSGTRSPSGSVPRLPSGARFSTAIARPSTGATTSSRAGSTCARHRGRQRPRRGRAHADDAALPHLGRRLRPAPRVGRGPAAARRPRARAGRPAAGASPLPAGPRVPEEPRGGATHAGPSRPRAVEPGPGAAGRGAAGAR